MQKIMQVTHLPLRLMPGDDLRSVIEAAINHSGSAAFVIAGIGSLSEASIRMAAKDQADLIKTDMEILTLGGSVSAQGSHLHITVADSSGRVTGGHVGYGCLIRTTAEILLALLPEWSFSREFDEATGYPELQIRKNISGQP